MATITERFGFTKPAGTESGDVSVINSNTDLTELYLGRTQDMIAPMYDDTATYDVGDIVTYESSLYKCITAISTAETFDPTKWEATTAVEEGSGGGGGSSVIPNPTGTPTDTLSTIGIDGTIYGIEGSGGGGEGYTETTIWSGSESTNKWVEPIVLNDVNVDEYDALAIQVNVSQHIVSTKQIPTGDASASSTIGLNGFLNTNGESVVGIWLNKDNNLLRIFTATNVTIVLTKVVGIKYASGGGGEGGSSEAEDINYDNTTSQLTADNVQEAIDEVVANAGTASENILTLQNVQGYDEYDETQTYAVGDYAIYNNIVYECTTAVTTAEPFDSTKWTATSIEQIIDGVKGDISQLNSSLNTFKRVDITTSTATFPSTISLQGNTYYEKIGRLVVISVNLKIISSNKTMHTIANFIPTANDRPEYQKAFLASDGDVDGLGQAFNIEPDGRLTLYNTKTGTTYCQGTAIYISRG